MKKAIPIFEIFIALLSVNVSVFLLPVGVLREGSESYRVIKYIMPAWMWGSIALVIAILIGVGLIINSQNTRMWGLVLATVFYAGFATAFFSGFSNFSSGTYTLVAVFSLVSIFYARYTEL